MTRAGERAGHHGQDALAASVRVPGRRINARFGIVIAALAVTPVISTSLRNTGWRVVTLNFYLQPSISSELVLWPCRMACSFK